MEGYLQRMEQHLGNRLMEKLKGENPKVRERVYGTTVTLINSVENQKIQPAPLLLKIIATGFRILIIEWPSDWPCRSGR